MMRIKTIAGELLSSYETKAVTPDLTNDQLGELLICEIYTSLKAHFGHQTSTEIIKAIFTSIVKHDMMIEQKKSRRMGIESLGVENHRGIFRTNRFNISPSYGFQ